jgi:hypothetical protein
MCERPFSALGIDTLKLTNYDVGSTKATPCAVATGLDIGLSNLSLKTVTLSFYSKPSSPASLSLSELLTM